jgi:hypothetical protein
MKFARLSILLFMLFPILASAQHVELGVFGNYSRVDESPAGQNLVGLGGRADINLARILQLELEMAYDFKYPHVQTTQGASAVVFNTTQLGVIHANAGLKLQSRGGSFFAFVKGGVNQYQIEAEVQTVTGVPPTVSKVRLPDRTYLKGILYPGAGIGFHAGPLGIRVDAGDEILWIDGSASHNFRLTFGPTIRF